MAQSFDIQDVILESTSEVSLKDLTRKGFKHVKVLNHATIQRLIVEAVDRVIDSRRDEIGASERRKVIDKSKTEFNAIAKECMQERVESAKLAAENESLRAETELLRGRIGGSMEAQAERDQALRQQESLERATESLRERLAASENAVAKYKGQLEAKNEELERLEATGGSEPGVGELRESLEGIQRSLAGISSGGGAVRRIEASDVDAMVKFAERDADDSGVESNIEKVEVKRAKAGGLKSALAKLKELQGGAQNDG